MINLANNAFEKHSPGLFIMFSKCVHKNIIYTLFMVIFFFLKCFRWPSFLLISEYLEEYFTTENEQGGNPNPYNPS